LALTCRSEDLKEELVKDPELKKEAGAAQSNQDNNLENEMDEDFFQEYLKKRIEEMQKKALTL
jgi:hypothetical protein